MTHDALCEHLSASGLGTIAVVACDKPPVGTLAALLEHDRWRSSCPMAQLVRVKTGDRELLTS